MFTLLHQLKDSITGWLEGYDRLAFVGQLLPLMMPEAANNFFDTRRIPRKKAIPWMKDQTNALVDSIEQTVTDATGQGIGYLKSPKESKEDRARRQQHDLGITQGLIGAYSCVEPCRSIRMIGGVGKPTLIPVQTQCKHIYVYQMHPIWGFMHTRIQTWFPYRMQVLINGREWLAHQLDQQGIGYERVRNKFISIDDMDRARQLQQTQIKTPWWTELNRLLPQAFPTQEQTIGPHLRYTWTCWQSEWATDFLFKDPHVLHDLMERMTQYAFLTGDSARLLRFFCRPGMIGKDDTIKNTVTASLQTKLKPYDDGMRIRHWYRSNSIKMYTEYNVLRFETTVNNPNDLLIYRHAQGASKDEPKKLQPMRKGVADMAPRAEISRRINNNYIQHVAASINPVISLQEHLRPYAKARIQKGRRIRALNPMGKDQTILTCIADPKYIIAGFTNKDIRQLLRQDARYKGKTDKQLSGVVSRLFRLLRDHGIIHKVPKRRRYRVSNAGRELIHAIQAALASSTQELARMAA